ncbi:MAG: hypothetical protein OEV40_02490 [Acidimicrobiia bacterium]|nr:hypothetical protein [Acidimicrobiia bacterium]
MILVYAAGTLVGLGIAIWASRFALNAAIDAGELLGVRPFVLGVTVVAVGTDLPEMANSIVASATDHGDLNVGDSIGSVVTQMTLVLGILALSGKIFSEPRSVIVTGGLTVAALLLGAVLIADRQFSRLDGAILITFWIVGSLTLRRREPAGSGAQLARESPPPHSSSSIARVVAITIGFLAIVGAGAAIAVESFSRAVLSFGAPEYLLSFFVLALGTSLPELVVDAQALRRSEGELAMGDVLGSSFVDATLSPGIGPLLFPTALGAGLVRGSLVVAVVIAVVTALVARDRVQRRSTGLVLILLYLALYPALIT